MSESLFCLVFSGTLFLPKVNLASTLWSAAASKNVDSEQVGFVNILFAYVYHLRSKAKQLQAKQRSVYYIGK